MVRFVQYNPTSLERNYKHDLLTEVDLGVPIDLILPETYSVDPSSMCVCVCVHTCTYACIVCVCMYMIPYGW